MSARLGSNYWRLFGANVVSNLGDGVAVVAYPWLASAITRDPVQISLIAVVTRLPWLLFSLPAGVLTDRLDRRKLIIWMNGFRFVVTLIVAMVVWASRGSLADPDAIATGTAPVPANGAWLLAVLYFTAFLFGVAEVIADNAAQTLMPSLVETDQLEKANGWLWGSETVANSFAGPPIGGLLLAIGFAIPFFFDAASFAIAAALIASLAGRFRAEPGATRPEGPASWWSDLKEGVRWLWGHRLLRTLAIMLGIMNALITLSLSTYVLFVQEVLGLDAARFGVLLWSGAVGGVLGSLFAPKVSARIGQGRSLQLVLLVSALGIGVTGITSSWGVVFAMAAVTSFVAVLWNVITVSLRQEIIPDRLLGRVNSVYRFFAWGMMPIGSLLAGATVALGETATSRVTALRLPFLIASVAYLAVFAVGVRQLTDRRLAEARTERRPPQ
ncbi:MAG: MFS transporter [Acidimicrobiia bacterium]|nr:MFS transporter [Acidimicrobiia bacterium]